MSARHHRYLRPNLEQNKVPLIEHIPRWLAVLGVCSGTRLQELLVDDSSHTRSL